MRRHDMTNNKTMTKMSVSIDLTDVTLLRRWRRCIPHICHFLYTGRIFKFKILHLEITQIYPKKVKYAVFLRLIWKNLHPTEFFTRAAPVVPVTNMRYGKNMTKQQFKFVTRSDNKPFSLLLCHNSTLLLLCYNYLLLTSYFVTWGAFSPVRHKQFQFSSPERNQQ